jgi:hypothetical protein
MFESRRVYCTSERRVRVARATPLSKCGSPASNIAKTLPVKVSLLTFRLYDRHLDFRPIQDSAVIE